jgi:murein DD-endopeptidase MepM/ murein hydrolase activator NlpD
MTRHNTRLALILALALFWFVLAALLPVAGAQDDLEPTIGALPTVQLTPTPTGQPEPDALSNLTAGEITLDLYFDSLPQGQAGLMRLDGAALTGGRASFADRVVSFFPGEEGSYFGLISTGMEQSAGTYDLSVVALMEDGDSETFEAQVRVTVGAFIRQEVAVNPDLAYLIAPEVERTEFARLDSIFAIYTEDVLWDDNGFDVPLDAERTAPFGAFRIFNGAVPTRHTGWDFTAGTGTPVVSMAAGRVAYAGFLDIRGNHVIIDHGYGIYSGYSHLSQIHVTRGQEIAAGQVIGVSGNTGRSSGAHLHWEVVVNGEFVDSVAFLAMWMP